MLFIKDKSWPNFFELIDKEYDRLVKTLKADGKNEIVNLWERDNPGKEARCVTVGDVVKDSIKEDGSKLPLDDVLTLPSDQCSENCYDYIFEIKQ